MRKIFGAPGLWVVVLVAAGLAALHLPYPFAEDQATFTWGARALSEGARYYLDFWDMKQPGIYWWYWLSGQLFGFDTFGIRWMDMLWAVIVAPILWAAIRQRGELAAVLAVCLSFGAFYAKAGALHLSQLEWLIGGPLAVVLWCLGKEPPTQPTGRIDWRCAWVGAMATVIATFKLMEALVPASMLAMALAHSHWRHKVDMRRLLRGQVLPFMVGAAAAALPIVVWLFVDGTLQATLWTAFVYPPEALREYKHSPLFRLEWSFHWFRRGNVWLAPWALWAVWNGVRHGRRLELLCLAWGLSAVAIISLQLLSFWEYHFDLLFMPLGVLAALGFCDVLDRLKERSHFAHARVAATVAMAISVIACMGLPLAVKAERFARTVPFTPDRLLAFEKEVDDHLPVLRRSASLVDRLSQPQERVVFWGDQRMVFVVDRQPVLQINGNTRFLRRQLAQAVDYVRQTRPSLVYLGKGRDVLTLHDGGSLPSLVEELYVRCDADELGTWYRLRTAGGC